MAEMRADIKLIVGLGNPGTKYTQTRHNAGFWFVEQLAASVGASFRPEKKFHGEVCKAHIAGRDVWMLKPDTFMNRSGQSVKSLMTFYRIEPEEILVAHDEIDMEPGIARLKKGGGHGGHNGLRDIVSHLASKDFHRLRIGVGHPGSKEQVADYVLHKASQDEQVEIDRSIDAAEDVMSLVMEGSLEKAMHRLHTK